jgi:hypothetical protein
MASRPAIQIIASYEVRALTYTVYGCDGTLLTGATPGLAN